jgi:hypothetical protein
VGHNDTISRIQKLLAEIPQGSPNAIVKVLCDVDFCMVAGIPSYDSVVDRTNVGNRSVIEISLVEL